MNREGESESDKEFVMNKKIFSPPALWRAVLAVAVFMAVGLFAGHVMSTEDIDPEADKILKFMSS